MQRKRNGTYVIIALICAVAFHESSGADVEERIDFSTKNIIDGSTFSSEQHKGRCMVIIFGSMYCKPCIQMIPIINQLHDTFKNEAFTAVGIDIDVTSDNHTLKQFAMDKNVRFYFLVDNNRVARQYKVFVLPTTLVVDPEGRIIKRYTNFQSYATLEKQVKKCLKLVDESGARETAE
ncbi:MAG: TlpA family protein disulfide reductase [Desulfobacterota bacterium]|nr:TlpA family protein disulfide reductase [Thermodesulfobacteriota bacterium]